MYNKQIVLFFSYGTEERRRNYVILTVLELYKQIQQ